MIYHYSQDEVQMSQFGNQGPTQDSQKRLLQFPTVSKDDKLIPSLMHLTLF